MGLGTGKLDRRKTKKSKISEMHRRVCWNIEEIRQERGITQKQMAEKLKMAQPTYNAIERARCDVLLGTLERVAAALGQPIQMLFIREPVHKGEKPIKKPVSRRRSA
jgi:transcriptional regulator with XRE-family HTH domain